MCTNYVSTWTEYHTVLMTILIGISPFISFVANVSTTEHVEINWRHMITRDIADDLL